jgi:GTP-binding protein
VLTVGAQAGEDAGGRDIIIADIPGLIEGASQGAGLGIRFLKHISRTAALAFLVDLGEDNYLSAFRILLTELEAFSPALVQKKRLLVGTKTDLPESAGRLEELAGEYPGELVRGISVFSGEGITELAGDFIRLTEEAEKKNSSAVAQSPGDTEDGWEDDGDFDIEGETE